MFKKLLTLGLFLLPTFSQAEVVETGKTPDEVILVVYPEGQGLVREKRHALVIPGSNKILIRNIPREVQAGSILLQAPSAEKPVTFTEYSFQSDLINRKSLLEGSLGIEVLLAPKDSEGPFEEVRLIAVDGSEAIIETPQGVKLGVQSNIQAVDANRIAFKGIPYRLTQHPLMTVKLLSEGKMDLDYEISYIAKGLCWDSSYTIIVSHDASAIDINNWIHIHNDTGVGFTKAHIRIAEGQREEESVTYNIERPITIPDQSSKNVEWFSAKNILTTKSYRLYSPAEVQNDENGLIMKPQAEQWLSVKNESKGGLDQALPAGVIKVFQKNKQGRLSYMGENKTTAIGIGETFSLRLGNTHDVTAEMKQTDIRRLSNQVVETGYTVTLTNQTNSALDISFIQKFKGEWSLLRETHPHRELNENAAEWKLSIPEKGTETLRFRLRMKTS
jgi:hypothetical protein